MTAPPIIDGLSPAAIVPLVLAAATALLFWTQLVPRQLRGLQVAFETGELRYEVHQVTRSVEEAKALLRSPGMRFGVTTYLFALVGVLILFFEFLITLFYVHILSKRYPHINFVKPQLQNPLPATLPLNPQAYKRSISPTLIDTE